MGGPQFYFQFKDSGGFELRTVVKCICECHQSGRRVVLDPEPVAMSTASCARVSFCSVSAI